MDHRSAAMVAGHDTAQEFELSRKAPSVVPQTIVALLSPISYLLT
jgi:hypothetical protein